VIQGLGGALVDQYREENVSRAYDGANRELVWKFSHHRQDEILVAIHGQLSNLSATGASTWITWQLRPVSQLTYGGGRHRPSLDARQPPVRQRWHRTPFRLWLLNVRTGNSPVITTTRPRNLDRADLRTRPCN